MVRHQPRAFSGDRSRTSSKPCYLRSRPCLNHGGENAKLPYVIEVTGCPALSGYPMQGHYLPGALRDINYILRDYHSDQVTPIDPQLLDLLYTIDKMVGFRDAFHVLSAYRSAATNAMLRLYYSGVAEHSMHMEGKAVDVRFPGSDLPMVHRLATDLQWGGVGFYPWASFVHLDTGPVRSW